MAQSYIDQLRGLVAKHGAEDSIKIHDYSALLQPHDKEFMRRYNEYFHALGENPEKFIDPKTLASVKSSVRACMNTRRLNMGYADHRALFGPDQDKNNPHYQLVEDMASIGFRDLLATKMASTEMNVPEDIWPGHVRVSCHKGSKNGRTGIAMRMYPSYYRSSKLLPYQGMPLLMPDNNGLPKLRVDPEIVLRGRPDLVRIMNDQDEAYIYVASSLLKN